jgi:hypothetical protein
MKAFKIAGVAAMTVLPTLALAGTHTRGELGALQAVYDYCLQVDSADSAALTTGATSLFSGMTALQIAAARNSYQYQRGYSMLSTLLPRVATDDAVSGCKALLAPSQSPTG